MTANALTIQPGDLRSQVLIQASSGADAAGQPNVWTTVRTAWAKISTQTSTEVYLLNQFTSTVTHIVTLRWTATPVAAGMRVVFGTRTFVVASVENVLERNIRMNLMCSEINGTV